MSDKSGRRETDSLEQLLRQAGPRAGIPKETEARLRAAARSALARKRAGRRRLQAVRWLAGAASLILIVWVVRTFPLQDKSGSTVLAQIVHQSGHAQTPVHADSEIVAGQDLATHAGETMTLNAMTGHTIRLAPGTTGQFVDARNLKLDTGAVYVDSGEQGSGLPLSIRTPFGLVTELGTRYWVDVADSGLQVRVRGGSVEVASDSKRHRADAGFRLTIDREGVVSVEPSPTYGPAWSWVLDAAVAPEIDGRPLSVLLDWVIRETGWELEFENPETAATAPDIGLSGSIGSIRGLSPEEALAAVLPTCGLKYHVNAGKLTIAPQ